MGKHIWLNLLKMLCLYLYIGTPLPAPSPPPGTPYNFNQDCVNSHNKLRAQHGSPPVTWNKALADHAQEWVNNLAKRDAFEHDIAGLAKYQEGENIAWFMGKGKVCTTKLTSDCYPCSKVVQPWYNEVKDYDFVKAGAKSAGLPVLHFTQVATYRFAIHFFKISKIRIN